MLKFGFSIAALSLVLATSTQAADLGGQSRQVVKSPTFAAFNPWEFQASIGPGMYALYNPFGKFGDKKYGMSHFGIAGELTASYRLNSWIAPMVGLRGFVSTSGRGINTGYDDSRFQPGIGQITDTGRLASSKATAIGLMAGVQFGSGSFRLTPYAFLDSVRLNVKNEQTFIVPGLFNEVSTGSDKLSARVLGVGLKTQYFFTDTFGITADAFAGSLMGGLKADEDGFKPKSSGRYAIGGKLAVSAKF